MKILDIYIYPFLRENRTRKNDYYFILGLNSNTMTTPKPVFQCSLCTYKSDREYNYNRHLDLVHSIKPILPPPPLPPPPPLIKNKCMLCDKVFTFPSRLKRHELSCKGKTYPKQCKYCYALFQHVDSKYRHQKTCSKRISLEEEEGKEEDHESIEDTQESKEDDDKAKPDTQEAKPDTQTKAKVKAIRQQQKKISTALRNSVWLLHNGETFSAKCYVSWCENKINNMNYDVGHNIPQSKGGTNHISNLFPICRTCNSGMGNWQTIDEFSHRHDKMRTASTQTDDELCTDDGKS